MGKKTKEDHPEKKKEKLQFDYEDELQALQYELIKLQEWVKAENKKITAQ